MREASTVFSTEENLKIGNPLRIEGLLYGSPYIMKEGSTNELF